MNTVCFSDDEAYAVEDALEGHIQRMRDLIAEDPETDLDERLQAIRYCATALVELRAAME